VVILEQNSGHLCQLGSFSVGIDTFFKENFFLMMWYQGSGLVALNEGAVYDMLTSWETRRQSRSHQKASAR
jgi:hypothetical protein